MNNRLWLEMLTERKRLRYINYETQLKVLRSCVVPVYDLYFRLPEYTEEANLKEVFYYESKDSSKNVQEYKYLIAPHCAFVTFFLTAVSLLYSD